MKNFTMYIGLELVKIKKREIIVQKVETKIGCKAESSFGFLFSSLVAIKLPLHVFKWGEFSFKST